jgi:hypothetical protein
MPLDLDPSELSEDVQPPPVLYHYTNTEAFLAIVETGVLRATHHRFLNDAGELSFGYKIACEVLESLRAEIGRDVVKETLFSAKAMLSRDCFLASLSQRHDDLSQWKAYANNGAGYCIGIRTEDRFGSGDDDDYRLNHCLKCEYGGKRLTRLLKGHFLRELKATMSPSGSGDPDDGELAEDLASLILRFAWLGKHHHFRAEEEWRIIVEAPKKAPIKFRAGSAGVTPFLETSKLNIQEVWIGPRIGPNKVVAKKTVRRLLQQHKIEAVARYWDSPFVSR